MRRLLPTFFMLAVLVQMLLASGVSAQQAQPVGPQFVLGFADLANQVGSTAGTPIENEHHGANGDGLQQTTTGLMVWRKADNWTAFTNGYWSWVNGPYGVQDRSNDQRFSWEFDDRQLNQAPAATPTPAAPAPTATPVPTSGPSLPGPAPAFNGIYKAKSPEYGMNIFLWGNPSTTARDLQKEKDAGFTWQKTLFQWRAIEGAGKGQFNWTEADRVVKASADAGIKIIARADFEPMWARADRANNGPPDNLQDYSDFMYALVNRYRTGSPYGHIDAVELWNEPNLAREWGDQKPDAGQYVALLKAGYEGTKKADPNVIVITAGLTPTESWDNNATPDDVFLQQMYDAGARAYFDVLGAHGAGYKAPPEMSPEAVAADPSYGGHRFFCFRRVEDLRNVMVRNGDSAKQVWLLEFGWTSDSVHPAYAWHAVSEDAKADYIVRAYKWAQTNWAPWVGVMTLWNLPDPSWTTDREEYWWSIANADGSNRPAYTKLQQARQSGYLP